KFGLVNPSPMQLHCTRPNCPSPINHFADLDDPNIPQPLKQKYCSACRMELILRGRYLPVDVLGQGGFGTAFLARDFDSPTRRRCVVKLFQPPVTLSPEQLATAQRLFGKEAVVLERLGLQHPQIPNLYAYFPLLVTNPLNNQSEELFYLVQEFIDGEDLEKILNSQGKFSEADVLAVLKAMLNVLDFVHTNGAIHRDVKPSNIMKARNGRLSLLDFGAVKEVTAPTGVQRGPTTICSPEYAPPEQIMNGTVDQTSDLYALAASCVVLLTDKTSTELRDSINNRWQWRSHVQVSKGLGNLLDRMLQPNPRDRYPSAQAVLNELPGSGAPSVRPTPQIPTTQKPTVRTNPSQTPKTTPTSIQPQSQSAQVQSAAQQQNLQPKANVSAAPVARPPAQPLSLPRFLGNAFFSGAQGGLLAIALASLMGTSFLSSGIWLAMLGGLGLLQFRRIIEGMDLVIIAGVTLGIVVFFRPLHAVLGGTDLLSIVMIAVMTGGVMVAIAVIFRLIFRLLSRIM
ncbi:MAG: serine/threonine-protein kinase, partial [Cyanobacteria bacterium J06649_4]